MLSLINVATIPLSLSFEPAVFKKNLFTYSNYVIDLMFLLDIIFSFRTTYIDDKGEEVLDSFNIAKNYIGTTFVVDVLATFPFDIFIS